MEFSQNDIVFKKYKDSWSCLYAVVLLVTHGTGRMDFRY